MHSERLEENQRIKEFDEGLAHPPTQMAQLQVPANASESSVTTVSGEHILDRQLDNKVCSGLLATMDTLTVFFEIQSDHERSS